MGLDFAAAAVEAHFSEKRNSYDFSELNLLSNKNVEIWWVRVVGFQAHLFCSVVTRHVELLLKGLKGGQLWLPGHCSNLQSEKKYNTYSNLSKSTV
jgi:hypothetical protein